MRPRAHFRRTPIARGCDRQCDFRTSSEHASTGSPVGLMDASLRCRPCRRAEHVEPRERRHVRHVRERRRDGGHQRRCERQRRCRARRARARRLGLSRRASARAHRCDALRRQPVLAAAGQHVRRARHADRSRRRDGFCDAVGKPLDARRGCAFHAIAHAVCGAERIGRQCRHESVAAAEDDPARGRHFASGRSRLDCRRASIARAFRLSTSGTDTAPIVFRGSAGAIVDGADPTIAAGVAWTNQRQRRLVVRGRLLDRPRRHR